LKLHQLLIFLAIFLTVYGGVHFYVYRRLTPLLAKGHWLLALVLCLLLLMPLLAEWLIHRDAAALAKPLTWIGFTWMGIVFLLFSTLLAVDLYRLLAGILHRLLPQLSGAWLLTPARGALIALLVTIVAAGYSFFEAGRLELEQVRLASPKLNGSQPIRIVQISDLHLGQFTRPASLERLTAMISSLRPDLIVSTGDLIDMPLDPGGEMAGILRKLAAPLGKFAVTGNHEAYAGPTASERFARGAGFETLSGAVRPAGNTLTLAGVDDPSVLRLLSGVVPERELLQGLPPERFVLLLKHQPVVPKTSRDRFDLQLSGHTHGGQIFPFNLLVRLVYRLPTGLIRLGESRWVYVSRGTGSWGPQMRLFAPAELTVIDLVPE